MMFVWKSWFFFFLSFQVVRAASPVLLRVILLGAFFIYSTVSTSKDVLNFLSNECLIHYFTAYSVPNKIIPAQDDNTFEKDRMHFGKNLIFVKIKIFFVNHFDGSVKLFFHLVHVSSLARHFYNLLKNYNYLSFFTFLWFLVQ